MSQPLLQANAAATPYGNALVEVAQKTNSLEAVHADVDALAAILKDNEVGAATWVLGRLPHPPWHRSHPGSGWSCLQRPSVCSVSKGATARPLGLPHAAC